MAHDSDRQSNVPQQTTTQNRDTITIVLPFKDQKSAKVVKLSCLICRTKSERD